MSSKPISTAALSAASSSGALALRDHCDDTGESEHADLEDQLHGTQIGDAAGMVLAPVPGRERRAPIELIAERVLAERSRRIDEARLEKKDREGEDRRHDEGRGEAALPLVGDSPFGYVSQRGARRSVANFVHPESATAAPRATGDVESQKPQTRIAGMIASFVFEFNAYAVNGNAIQPKTSPAASGGPPKRRPTRNEAEYDEEIECDRRRVRCGKRVPLPGPRKDENRRDVRQVGDRPVRVPAGKDDSQRPLSWIQSRIEPSASGFPQDRLVPCTGMFPYGARPSRILSPPITPA